MKGALPYILATFFVVAAWWYFTPRAKADEPVSDLSSDPDYQNAASFLDPALATNLAQLSSSLGVDSYAVLAVVHQEGSSKPGSLNAIDDQHYPSGDSGHSHGPLQVDDQFHAIDGQGGYRGFSGAPSDWDAVGNQSVLNVGISFLGQLIQDHGGVSALVFTRYNGSPVYGAAAMAWYELNAPSGRSIA